MCGRFNLDVSWGELYDHYSLTLTSKPVGEMPARYNIAPTQPILMVADGASGQGEAMLVRWGLMPAWVKDPADFTLLTNARSETAAQKPSFRTAMRHRRTLVPASGFYEWKRFGKGKKSQPYWVRPKNGGLVTFGGLMETWADPNGSEIDTGCILTTAANDSFAKIHHRLPLVIQPADFARWLDCRTREPRDIADLLAPVDGDYFEAVPVSDAVNKVANSGPGIQQRVKLAPSAETSSVTDEQMTLF